MVAQPINREDYIAPFEPNSRWQVKAWRDKAMIQLNTGSAGGGKSRLTAEKVHAYCLKYPGVTALMLRKSREVTTNSIVAFMKDSVMGGDKRVHHAVGNSRFEYANGSMLIYGGMRDKEQREAIRSVGGAGGVDLIWMEEATQFVEQDFNELTARLRGTKAPWRQILLTTNPDSPTHWIYKRLIQGGEASVYYSGAKDNPANPADYLELLQKMTGVQYQRLVLGRWVQSEGAVYEEFDPAKHIIDYLPHKQWKRAFIGVDWGFTNPGVMQLWLLDGDGRMYQAYEIYQTQRLVSGVKGEEGWWISKGKWLMNYCQQQFGVEADTFVCDPSEPAYIETLNANGLRAVKAENSIRMGIDSVKARLKVIPKDEGGDGLPRIYFLRDACAETDIQLEQAKKPTSTLDEFPAYIWPVVKGATLKEVPVKENDHGMDTTRYSSVFADTPAGIYFG